MRDSQCRLLHYKAPSFPNKSVFKLIFICNENCVGQRGFHVGQLNSEGTLKFRKFKARRDFGQSSSVIVFQHRFVTILLGDINLQERPINIWRQKWNASTNVKIIRYIMTQHYTQHIKYKKVECGSDFEVTKGITAGILLVHQKSSGRKTTNEFRVSVLYSIALRTNQAFMHRLVIT